MGGRPLFAAILSFFCVLAGVGGLVFFSMRDPIDYHLMAASAGAMLVGVGLWNQWRWSWWAGLVLCFAFLYHAYTRGQATTNHEWFIAGTLTVYFLATFREYN